MASNIQPQSGINAALARVDYSPPLQAELATGPIKAEAQMKANLRKIEEANSAMKEFQQKKEKRELTKKAVGYIQNLFTEKPQVAKQFAVDPEDTAAVKNYVDVLGGPKEAIKSVADAVKVIEENAADQRIAQTEANADSRVAQYVSDVNSGVEGVRSKEEAISRAVNKYGFTTDQIDIIRRDVVGLPNTTRGLAQSEYLDLVKYIEADGSLQININKGVITYDPTPGSGSDKKELKPGDPMYESLKRDYPNGFRQLEARVGSTNLGTGNTRPPQNSLSQADEIVKAFGG